MSTPNPAAVKAWLLDLQARIVQALEAVDGKPFLRDAWERAEGGGGISRLIEEGNVFERGGVNFSHVRGASLPPSAMAARPELAGAPGKRWACRWCCIRAIRMRRPCT
jgi:coproporphyrinogen III oxidase